MTFLSAAGIGMPDYDDGKLIYWPPPLNDVWLDEHGCWERKAELEQQ